MNSSSLNWALNWELMLEKNENAKILEMKFLLRKNI